MRRLEPQATVLPPISPVDVTTDGAGWTVTERRLVAGGGVSAPKALKKASASPRIAKATSNAASGSQSARGVAGERDRHSGASRREASPEQAAAAAAVAPDAGEGPVSPLAGPPGVVPGAGKPPNLMKGRAIETWLNHTLCQASKPESGSVSSASAKQTKGLAHFGVDLAALEKLGLDTQTSERVYRAMFVYSQGLHGVLREAVGKAKGSSAALLVLWRAFTAMMEHVGQSEEKGESVATLVQRGNEEERAKIEAQYKDQVNSLQVQTQKMSSQRRALQEEVARLREDEARLRSESDMYRTEHENSTAKYEKEIKLRVDAEVRFLDRTRWAESLQQSLEKERQDSALLRQQLKEEVASKESALVELESMRTQVKVLEAQVTNFKQLVAEAAQQKQRHEQQVGQLKQQLDRHDRKMQEVKDQLEHEQETAKRLQEQTATQMRELRKLERQCEDESHIRRDLQNERDNLREKLDKADKDISELTEERRQGQKKFNDLSMAYRTNEIDLKRKTESCDRAEASLEKLTAEHKDLVEYHREIVNEVEALRDEVQHQEKQLVRETDLRKQLQQEKKLQAGELQTLSVQLDSAKFNLQNTQKEFESVTDAKVKLESIVRDTKSSMQKSNLEHQVELKAHIQKVAMLEKVIADERNERRNLVAETQEVVGKREETYQQYRRAELEIRDLRRLRLEKEEEVDRYKVLLNAQEQRNVEQLVIVDKYHAAVANHNAEMRQMQVLLESERVEAKKKLQKLQDASAQQRTDLELRIERWKLSYEDVLSQVNFNPLTAKIAALELEVEDLQEHSKELEKAAEDECKKAKVAEERLRKKDEELKLAQSVVAEVERKRDEWKAKYEGTLIDLEHAGIARADAEHQCERIKKATEAFDQMKDDLERKLQEAVQRYEVLVSSLKKTVEDKETQVIIHNCDSQAQTDLSYQYLESSSRLHQEPGRRERLEALVKASNFVDGLEDKRDFAEHIRPTAVPLAQMEYRFEDAKGAARLHLGKPGGGGGAPLTVSALISGGALLPGGVKTILPSAPVAPEPYPRHPVRPAGRPPAGRAAAGGGAGG